MSPGSDIVGVPASDIIDTFLPSKRRLIKYSHLSTSLYL